MNKSILGLSGIAFMGWIAYRYKHEQRTNNVISNIRLTTQDNLVDLKNVVNAKNDLSNKLGVLKNEIASSKSSLESIKRSVNAFNFKLNSHLDLIQRSINDIKN